jgi:hypothetical protein
MLSRTFIDLNDTPILSLFNFEFNFRFERFNIQKRTKKFKVMVISAFKHLCQKGMMSEI